MKRTSLFPLLLWALVNVTVAGCGDEENEDEGKPGPAILLPAQVQFTVFCGSPSPDSVKFLVRNAGNEALSVSSATATGGFTVTADLPITVLPGATVAVTVTPPAPVIGTDEVGDVKLGKLTVNSNDPLGRSQVELAAVVDGAELAFEGADGKALSKVDLRSDGQMCPPPQTVFLKNSGVRTVTIGEISGDNPVEQVTDAMATIAPGGRLEYRVLANATEGCVTSGQESFPVSGGSCASSVSLPVTQQVNGNVESCFCTNEVPAIVAAP